MNFAKLLRTPFLWNTSSGCFCSDKKNTGHFFRVFALILRNKKIYFTNKNDNQKPKLDENQELYELCYNGLTNISFYFSIRHHLHKTHNHLHNLWMSIWKVKTIS